MEPISSSCRIRAAGTQITATSRCSRPSSGCESGLLLNVAQRWRLRSHQLVLRSAHVTADFVLFDVVDHELIPHVFAANKERNGFVCRTIFFEDGFVVGVDDDIE